MLDGQLAESEMASKTFCSMFSADFQSHHHSGAKALLCAGAAQRAHVQAQPRELEQV